MKKVALALATFGLVGACVFFAGTASDSSVSLPQPVTADSPCPVVGCASGSCHGFEDVPEPDGVHEMKCPRATCASVECHAWDALTTRYCRPSDASLNLWLVLPVALVVGAVLLVKKVK